MPWVTSHFRRGIQGTFVRGYRRAKHRPGSNVRLGTTAPEEYGRLVAYVDPKDRDLHTIYIEPGQFDEEGRPLALPGRMEDILSHETLHQVVARMEGVPAAQRLDRMTHQQIDIAPVGTRFHLYSPTSARKTEPFVFGRPRTDRQHGYREAARRKELRLSGAR